MKSVQKKKSAYARAGVDIDEMMAGLDAAKRMINGTAIKGVLSTVGSFGGLFQLPGTGNVLVASTDGVGTKLKVALMARRHDTVGRDLVNHCVNDILVQGAKPLFFLDYLGASGLTTSVFVKVISGLCVACRQNGCALLGGETAEMPGLYPKGEYDLVGTIIGVVPRRRIITGSRIKSGDVIIGLPSSGLHTNGYSLARKVIFEKAGLTVAAILPGTRRTVGDVLLAVHRSYLAPVQTMLHAGVPIHGMAHITGGGLPDNTARIMPDGTSAVYDRSSWQPPPVFSFIRKTGRIDLDEMYRVFNMGIGLSIIMPPSAVARATGILK
ncbi:MAG: phosphoribosylformylglycinamidine cyclo-ligase, partial [Lentisphaerales bacterium]